MNSKICTLLVFYCWIAGFLIIFVPLLLTINLDFCTSNIVDHFVCDPATFLQIFCSDTQLTGIMGFISALMTLVITLSVVTTSYAYIALAILNILSANERKKVFSTCPSHMIVIFSYGSCFFMYVKPSGKDYLFTGEYSIPPLPHFWIPSSIAYRTNSEKSLHEYNTHSCFFFKQVNKLLYNILRK